MVRLAGRQGQLLDRSVALLPRYYIIGPALISQVHDGLKFCVAQCTQEPQEVFENAPHIMDPLTLH